MDQSKAEASDGDPAASHPPNLDLTAVSHLLRSGEISACGLVQRCLSAIHRLNPTLNAFVTVSAEQALSRASEIDGLRSRGEPCGPLCGVPVAVKDIFATRGVRTALGSKLFEHNIPDFSATAVQRLESAGAIVIGKTGMHELAYGVTSENPYFGAVRNSHNPDRIAGGSSGGSAVAVAAGMAFAALGTDTGGSIRIPASYCGIVGLKPTFGRVSRFGVYPLGFSLDHVGPMTSSVRDAALLLSVLSGHDPRDPASSRRALENFLPPPGAGLRRIRVGLPQNFFFHQVDPEVHAAVTWAAKLAEQAGATVVPVELPDVEHMNELARLILLCEASSIYEADLRRSPDSFGEDVRSLLRQGLLISAVDYLNAQRLRRLAQRDFARIWSQIDVLFAPSTPSVAPPVGAKHIRIAGELEDVRTASTRFTRVFNLLGLPAISLPIALNRVDKLPTALQIAGPPFGESRVLLVAASLEELVFSSTFSAPLA